MKKHYRIICILLSALLLCSVGFALFKSTESVRAIPTQEITSQAENRKSYAENLQDIEKNIDTVANTKDKATLKDKIKEWGKAGVDKFRNLKTYQNAGKTALNSLLNIVKDVHHIDWLNAGWETGTTVVSAVLSCWPPADSIFNALTGFIKNSGQKPRDEMEMLKIALNKQFDEVAEHLDDIQSDISNLSDQVDESTREILDALTNAFEANYAKEEVIDFMSSTNGNFSYKQFKNFLFGSTDSKNNPFYYGQAYYNSLLSAISQKSDESNPAHEELIEEKYNALYRSLESKSSQKDTNLNMFYDYLLYDEVSGKESIVHYYYDYLLYNNKLLADKSAEFETLKFMTDLYATALFANHCKLLCNYYQQVKLFEEYDGTPSNSASYTYGSGDEDSVTYEEILKSEAEIESKEELLKAQMASDLAYVFNLGGSFSVENKDGQIYIVNHSDNETFGKVCKGDTVYLNKLDPALCYLFDIDPNKFTYECHYNGKKENNDGIIRVDDDFHTFKAVVSYGDRIIYTIDFEIEDESNFAGGNGSISDPYIIKTAEQFKLISSLKNGLKKNYILAADIDFANENIMPVGNDKEPFVGTLDGKGYKIKNIKATSDEYIGLLGYIGASGKVQNLTIEDCEFNSKSNKDTPNEKGTIYAGIIAGFNSGVIYNCSIVNCTVNVYGNILSSNANMVNSPVNVYAGGIAGQSLGNIIYCNVDNCTIDASSKRDYGAESDQGNSTFVYAGGIAGILKGSAQISSCSIQNQSSISAYGMAVCAKVSGKVGTRYPRITVKAGGIAAEVENIECVENVYSEAKISRCDYNSELIGASVTKNDYCTKQSDNYIPAIEQDKLEKIKVNKDSIKFPDKSPNYEITYEFNSAYNQQYFCFEDQLYDCNERELKTENLRIKLNGKETKYTIISYYNFDTVNHKKSASQNADVTLVFSADYNGTTVIDKINFPITIKENKPIELKVLVTPSQTNYQKDEQVNIIGGSFGLVYQDGTIENVTSIVQLSCDTSKYGQAQVTITYNGFSATYDITVECKHQYFEQTVQPTCTKKGYTKYTCTICGDEYLSEFRDMTPHETTLQNKKEATCMSTGYTGDYICTECGQIIEYGNDIAMLPHNFHSDILDVNVHVCEECGYREEHQLISIENTGVIIYSCAVCGYVCKEESIVSDEMARVRVSEGYYLKGSKKEVAVYVEILNNPGLTGASFRIYYDKGLKYLGFEKGEVMATASTFVVEDTPVIKNTPLANAISITIANAGAYYESGNLLKLVFSVDDDAAILDEFDLNISYSLSADRFSDSKNRPIDILTIPGKITVVDHLPGDVNNDDVVDILDAVLIARYFNSNGGRLDFYFDVHYADVNLDGKVSITDLVEILRYLVGGYGAKIINNEFKIVLNTNDGQVDFETFLVQYYKDNGNIGNFGDLGSLPELNKAGYRFDGWYTKLVGGERIDNLTQVFYNYNQDKQTLYAHYTLNSVSFDGNGATKGDMPSMNYGNVGDSVILTNKFEKISYVTFRDRTGTKIGDQAVKHVFLGWATELGGDVVYTEAQTLDLKNSNIGNLTLYAVWSEEQIELTNGEKLGYRLNGWSTDRNGENLVGTANGKFTVTEDITLYANWELIKYTIKYDRNNGYGNMADGTFDIENGGLISVNKFTRTGYEFTKWNVSNDGHGDISLLNGSIPNESIRHLIQYYVVNGVLTLYAQWDPYTVTITFYGNIPNYGKLTGSMPNQTITYDSDKMNLYLNKYIIDGWIFNGWALYANGEVEYKDGASLNSSESTKWEIGELNLFAVWAVDPYNVSKYVSSGCIVSDTVFDGNSYVIYKNISATPWTPAHSKAIIDWSGETKLSMMAHTDRKGVLNQRYNNIDITNSITDVYFIGASNKTFEDLHIYLVQFAKGQKLTINFKDFKFTTNDALHAIGLYDDKGIDLTINIVGDCSIGTQMSGGNIIDLSGASLTITGSGSFTVRGGDGAPGKDGGTGIFVKNLKISGNINLTVRGGNGVDGADGIRGKDGKTGIFGSGGDYDRAYRAGTNGENGSDGANGTSGGNAVFVTSLKIQSGIITFIGGYGGNGGSGGRGGNGGDGASGEQYWVGAWWGYYRWAGNGGNGGQGGNGGNGGRGGSAVEISSPDRSSIQISGGTVTFRPGRCGDGGRGGDGGFGGNGHDDDWADTQKGSSGGNGGPGGRGGSSCAAQTGETLTAMISRTGGGYTIVDANISAVSLGGGRGGSAGHGGKNVSTKTSNPGAPGDNGFPGRDGEAGKVLAR